MAATTADESTPPDKYAPNGASLRILIRTASLNVLLSSSAACASESTSGSTDAIGGSKYLVTARRPSSQIPTDPGGSFLIERKRVAGPGTYRSIRNSANPFQSILRSTP